MAFSVSNVHYSRLALNNIVTQFFWATCFFFFLRALRSRRPSHWALAGAAGFSGSLLLWNTASAIHPCGVYGVPPCTFTWKQALGVRGRFPPAGGKILVGFGPLLVHFIRNPNLYLGRGASLLIWSPHIPMSFADFHSAWKTIWPVLSENLARNQHSRFTRHQIPIVMCRRGSHGPGPCSAFVALTFYLVLSPYPRFPGSASCSSAERSWRIRTVCHL